MPTPRRNIYHCQSCNRNFYHRNSKRPAPCPKCQNLCMNKVRREDKNPKEKVKEQEILTKTSDKVNIMDNVQTNTKTKIDIAKKKEINELEEDNEPKPRRREEPPEEDDREGEWFLWG